MGRCPKGAGEKNNKLVLELFATLVHGQGLYLWITDEDTSIGSEWQCEIVCPALELVWQRAQAKGQQWWDKLIIQSDNDTRGEELTLSTISHVPYIVQSVLSHDRADAACGPHS